MTAGFLWAGASSAKTKKPLLILLVNRLIWEKGDDSLIYLELRQEIGSSIAPPPNF